MKCKKISAYQCCFFIILYDAIATLLQHERTRKQTYLVAFSTTVTLVWMVFLFKVTSTLLLSLEVGSISTLKGDGGNSSSMLECYKHCKRISRKKCIYMYSLETCGCCNPGNMSMPFFLLMTGMAIFYPIITRFILRLKLKK